MVMPVDVLLVRHGQSESNVIQKLVKSDPKAQAPEGFYDRHDSAMRLSPFGREQAERAGDWLREQGLTDFDRCYVSPHIRAQETASLLRLGATWYLDDLWRERDWGEYGILSNAEREERHLTSMMLKKQHPWYWCPPGGESLATGVRSRFYQILHTLHREVEDGCVLAVTHGEMIETVRFVLERMTPDEWLADERNPERKIHNCLILHYTRRDPKTGEIAPYLNWRRAVCPWDDDKSWNTGTWTPLTRTTLTDADLTTNVTRLAPLLGE